MTLLARQALRMSSSTGSSASLAASNRLLAISRHMSSHRHALQDDVAAAAADGLDSIPIRYDGVNDARIYRLTRDGALNSLTHEMITSLSEKMRAWRNSEKCKLIIGTGGARAFCAGGDVKQLVQDVKKGKNTAIPFFKDEFELNWLLGRLGKPYVLFMDGIIMGGGCGIGLPAHIRIATPRTHFAMPETKIGYSPDVGVNYYLAQLDGHIGDWLAVTGHDLFGRSVYELGLATHYVDGNILPALLEELSQHSNPTFESISALVASYTMVPSLPEGTESTKKTPDASTAIKGDVRALLDEAFGKSDLKEVYHTLQAASQKTDGKRSEAAQKWAQEQVTAMDARSPTGMAVALENLRRARQARRLDSVLNNDMSMASAFSGPKRPTDDFLTGVTAVLIHKTASKTRPKWSPSTIEDVSTSSIAENFFGGNTQFAKAKPDLNLDPLPINARDRDETWNQFRKYGLPSESELQGIISGSSPGSGAFKVTEGELIDNVLEAKGEVAGPRKNDIIRRIKEVVEMRCTKDNEFLSWQQS